MFQPGLQVAIARFGSESRMWVGGFDVRGIRHSYIACRDCGTSGSLPGRFDLLTEDQVHRSFRDLFSSSEITEDALANAEELLDELRLESPLRHRLSLELDELRKLALAKG